MEWLKKGDKNTHFFHQIANQRKQKNTIRHLQDKEGQWKDSFEDLQNIMVEFYSSLFMAGEIGIAETCC